jgi:hypothetical protein
MVDAGKATAASRQDHAVPMVFWDATADLHDPTMRAIFQPNVVTEHLGTGPKIDEFGDGLRRLHIAYVANSSDTCQPH